MTKKKPLRDEMPMTAWFIDFAREVFGKEAVDKQIRAGMNGEPVFHAEEGSKVIGTPVQHWDAIGWDPVTGCAVELRKRDGQ